MKTLEAVELTKTFGKTKANDKVCLDLDKGEILAILGENGSGKSTLMNMLSGIYSPETGKIFIDGKECSFSSPQQAIRSGIGMVHQHFKLVDVMTAAQNITLGEKSGGFFISQKKIKEKIEIINKKFEFNIDLDKKIYEMSVSEKQTVEILKILYQGAKILILDEPTAVLTPQETKNLFKILLKMKEQGCSIIIITHKLNEVMEISDRISIMRKGRSEGTVLTKNTNQNELASLMVGEKVSLDIPRPECQKTKMPVLVAKDITVEQNGSTLLNNFSFDLYGGEILGVAGIVGSGQKQLCEALAGLTKTVRGAALFEGQNLLEMTPEEIRKAGIRFSFVPEDRLGMGLVAGMNITENLMLKNYTENKGILLDKKDAKNNAKRIVDTYSVRTPSVTTPIRQLSGGNIQKVLLAREIEMAPKILVAAYPFRGLDIGAVHNIISLLNKEKEKGVAILLIGEDIDQLCGLSDRLMVMHQGHNMGIKDPRKITKEQIGLMMTGELI